MRVTSYEPWWFEPSGTLLFVQQLDQANSTEINYQRTAIPAFRGKSITDRWIPLTQRSNNKQNISMASHHHAATQSWRLVAIGLSTKPIFNIKTVFSMFRIAILRLDGQESLVFIMGIPILVSGIFIVMRLPDRDMAFSRGKKIKKSLRSGHLPLDSNDRSVKSPNTDDSLP